MATPLPTPTPPPPPPKPPNTAPVPVSNADINENVTATGDTFETVDGTLTILGKGKVIGRSRTYDEDNNNIQRMLNVQTAQQSIAQTRANNIAAASAPATKLFTDTNSATTSLTSTTNTASAELAAAARATSIKPKDEADLLRARQNLQRRCNHSFSKITIRCIYCDKHRNSHVFDV